MDNLGVEAHLHVAYQQSGQIFEGKCNLNPHSPLLIQSKGKIVNKTT